MITKTDHLKDAIQSVDHPLSEILISVLEQLQYALARYPEWPESLTDATMIVMEEAGELCRASLQVTYEGQDLKEVNAEAIQTMAMCLRLLANLPQTKSPKSVGTCLLQQFERHSK